VPPLLPHINIECQGDRYPELEIHVSELILVSYEYVPIAYFTMIKLST